MGQFTGAVGRLQVETWDKKQNSGLATTQAAWHGAFRSAMWLGPLARDCSRKHPP
jgi:hypothetical protein